MKLTVNEERIMDAMIELEMLSQECYIILGGHLMPVPGEKLNTFRTKLYSIKDELLKKENLAISSGALAAVINNTNSILPVAVLYSLIAGNKKAEKDMKKWDKVVQASKEVYKMLQQQTEVQ